MADDKHLDSIWKPVAEFIINRNNSNTLRWHLFCTGCQRLRVAAFNRDQAGRFPDGTARRRFKCKDKQTCGRSWSCLEFCKMTFLQLTLAQRDQLRGLFPDQVSDLMIMTHDETTERPLPTNIPPPPPPPPLPIPTPTLSTLPTPPVVRQPTSPIIKNADPPFDSLKHSRDPGPTGETPSAKRSNIASVDLARPAPFFPNLVSSPPQPPSADIFSIDSFDHEYIILHK